MGHAYDAMLQALKEIQRQVTEQQPQAADMAIRGFPVIVSISPSLMQMIGRAINMANNPEQD